MSYFSQLDNTLRERGIVTPALRYDRARRPVAFSARTVRCYRRDGAPICAPCSDIKDREHPSTLRGDALCCVCGERLDDR